MKLIKTKIFVLSIVLLQGITLRAEEDVDPYGPWMVCEIAVSGNKNIAARTVIKAGEAKKGREYMREYVYEDVTAIMALDNFDNVQVDVTKAKGVRKDKEDGEEKQCHKITYIVKEKPIFDKIEYVGRKKLSRSAITEAMSLKVKDPYNETKLEADMGRIEEKYAEKGYINAKVNFETAFDETQNIVIVKLIIEEGVRTRVKDVVIEGLHNLPVKKVMKKGSNRPGKVFKPQNLPADYVKMMLYGRNKGYSEFDMTKPETEMNEDKSEVTIKYKVAEGTMSRFGQTAFDGNTVFTDRELQEAVIFRQGKIYNQNDFDQTMRALQEKYADKGYLQAQINPKREQSEGMLNVEFDIKENDVFYVGHVDVSGNETTKKNVLTREVTVKPGDRFDYSKIRRTQTKLMNLGFINDVQLEMSPTAYPDKVDLDFHVVEGRPGMFTAAVAMSSLDGLYGEISVNHLNLFGRAQRLSFRTMFGKNILDYTVSWSVPWVFDRPTSFGVDLFNTRRYRPYRDDSRAYTERRTGGRVNVGPRFNEDIYYLGIFYSLQNIDVFDIEEQYKGEIDKGNNIMSSAGINFAIDTRDNIWDPTSGWRNSIGLELSGGPFAGDLDIWSLNLKSVFNYKLLDIAGNYPIVFVLSNKFGVSKPYGRTDELPVYERFFIGGADTVRGYNNTGQIGPETGGEMYYVANAEIRLPLAREGRRNIAQLALFADAGNAWNNFNDLDWSFGPDKDQFKAGIGLGLRFATPQLPIRLDWGYGLNHKSGDKKAHFYFNMSNSF